MRRLAAAIIAPSSNTKNDGTLLFTAYSCTTVVVVCHIIPWSYRQNKDMKDASSLVAPEAARTGLSVVPVLRVML